MESCVVSLSEILKSVSTDIHYYLSMGTNKLEIVRIFEEIGLGAHIAGYSTTVLFLTLAIYVWVRTRARKEGGIR